MGRGVAVVSREQVLSRVRAGKDHADAGHVLGIPPGQAHLVASAVPGDGRSSVTTEQQGLLNPTVENPTSKAHDNSLHPRATGEA